MVYSKEVTAIILSDWAKGASAEETHKHLKELYGKAPCLNTIYTHRNGLTAQMLVDELLRQQQRDIVKSDSPALRMKYRDLLLAKLLPQRIEQKIEGAFNVDVGKEVDTLIQFSRGESEEQAEVDEQ